MSLLFQCQATSREDIWVCLLKRKPACGERIVAVREVGGENGTGSRQLVSESDHSRLRNVRCDGDFIGTLSGPINVVDLKRRE